MIVEASIISGENYEVLPKEPHELEVDGLMSARDESIGDSRESCYQHNIV